MLPKRTKDQAAWRAKKVKSAAANKREKSTPQQKSCGNQSRKRSHPKKLSKNWKKTPIGMRESKKNR